MAGILLIYILGIYFLLTKMMQLEDEAVVGVKKTHKELSETTHSSNEKAIQYVASNMIKEAPKIAITFDDGPSPAWTPKLLDGLKERNVKATFFLIGENAENTPELVKRESEEGHLVGNHTYHHVEITRVPDETAKEEILMTNDYRDHRRRSLLYATTVRSLAEEAGVGTGCYACDVDDRSSGLDNE